VKTWDVMITSIPHRHATLLRLLECLDAQAEPGFGAILYRDDLEASYGYKTQMLTEASGADYVSSVDDDDLLAPDAVRRIMSAIQAGPDYIGFRVRWNRDGVRERKVIHSLHCGEWRETPECLYRDITQFNPIRRELSLLHTWEGGYEAERRWGNTLRASGQVKTEVLIDDEVYYYEERTNDTFTSGRTALGTMEPLPSYPWLRQIGPYS